MRVCKEIMFCNFFAQIFNIYIEYSLFHVLLCLSRNPLLYYWTLIKYNHVNNVYSLNIKALIRTFSDGIPVISFRKKGGEWVIWSHVKREYLCYFSLQRRWCWWKKVIYSVLYKTRLLFIMRLLLLSILLRLWRGGSLSAFSVILCDSTRNDNETKHWKKLLVVFVLSTFYLEYND